MAPTHDLGPKSKVPTHDLNLWPQSSVPKHGRNHNLSPNQCPQTMTSVNGPNLLPKTTNPVDNVPGQGNKLSVPPLIPRVSLTKWQVVSKHRV